MFSIDDGIFLLAGPALKISTQSSASERPIMAKHAKNNNEPDFIDWIRIGIENNWISEPYCNTHDGGYEYFTEEEAKEWEDGGDPCELVIRVFDAPAKEKATSLF